jgi:hypothetical protein
VGGVVIQREVQVQLRGRRPVNLLQEFQPLGVGVLGGRAPQDFAFQVVEGILGQSLDVGPIGQASEPLSPREPKSA